MTAPALPLLLLQALVITVLVPVGSRAAEALPAAQGAAAEKWETWFDGKTLSGWKASAFDTQKPLRVESPFRDGPGAIILEKSDYLCGITRDSAEVPRTNYEISLEAMKLEGSDFFCGLTFPVGPTACTFVVGGWGGMVVGLSCIDNADASENETSQGMEFAPNRWYRIRVRVTPERIAAWIDQDQLVDLELAGKTIDLRFGDIKHSLPLGIAAFQTRSAVREIRLRRL